MINFGHQHANSISNIDDETKFNMIIEKSSIALDLASKSNNQEFIKQIVEVLVRFKRQCLSSAFK